MNNKTWPMIRRAQYKTGAVAYVVDARIAGKGKRYFFGSRSDADTKAQQLRVERKNRGATALNFPDRLRIEAMECTEKLAPFKKSLRDAVNFYLPHLQAEDHTCSINALVDQLIETKRLDGASKRYLGDLSHRLGLFRKSFDGKNVSDFTAPEIDHWLRSLGVKAVTRNNFRRVLIVAFQFATKHSYCVENPVKATAKAKVIETPVGILSPEELARLLEKADSSIVPFIAIGAFAGLRRAELERLDWREVDLRSGLIQITAAKAKTARRRFVKIQPNLAKWLQPHAQLAGSIAPLRYRELLDTARADAGIKDWPQNALRHSFASYHLAQFKNAAELALELGHTNAHLVFQHYREVVRPKEAARYWQIAPARGTKKIVAFSR